MPNLIYKKIKQLWEAIESEEFLNRLKDPNINPEELTGTANSHLSVLSNDLNDPETAYSHKILKTIASNPATPSKTLDQMSQELTPDPHGSIIHEIGKNPSADFKTITRAATLMGRIDNYDAIGDIVQNPALPLHLLEDPNIFKKGLRSGVLLFAKNPKTPDYIQNNIANINSTFLNRGLAQNPNVHPEIARKIFNPKTVYDEIDAPTHSYLVNNPNTPDDILHFYKENLIQNPTKSWHLFPLIKKAHILNDAENSRILKTLEMARDNEYPSPRKGFLQSLINSHQEFTKER